MRPSESELPPYAPDGTPRHIVLAGLCNAADEEGIERCRMCKISCKTGDRLAGMLGYERIRQPHKRQTIRLKTYYGKSSAWEKKREERIKNLLAAKQAVLEGADKDKVAESLGYMSYDTMRDAARRIGIPFALMGTGNYDHKKNPQTAATVSGREGNYTDTIVPREADMVKEEKI